MPLNPKTVVSLVPASVPVANAAQKVLFVAQQTAVATQPVDTLTENIGSNGEESGFFGRTSPLRKLVAAFKKSNPVSQCDAIGVGDGTTARVHTITVTGPATAAGTLSLVVGSQKNHQYQIAVADTDTATAIATAIRSAVNADLDCHFTATGATGDIILTADTKGITPNAYPIGWRGELPAGVTLAFVETTAGATDPDTSATLDVVGARRYQVIVWALDVVEGTSDDVVTFLDARFNSTNGKVEDGIVLYTNFNLLAAALTRNNAFNSENAIPICYNKITDAAKYFGPHIMEGPDEVNAYLAGIITLRLTDGESIAQFLTSRSTAEQFGGPKGASLPIFNTPMKGIASLTEPGREFTELEIDQINDSGGSVIGNNDADTEVITGQIYTTYKTLPSSSPDVTWEFLNYRLTGAGIREYFHSNLRAKYGQSRLTDGELTEDADVANKESIEVFCTGLYSTLTGPTFILTEKGEVALKFFKENLSVVLDTASGLVTIAATVLIVTQLRQINMTIKLAFSTEGA